MKRLNIAILSVLSLLGTSLLPLPALAASYRVKASDTYVHSYTKKNGTHVNSYYRSKADGIKSNNYGKKYR